jgi:hypothetical protein
LRTPENVSLVVGVVVDVGAVGVDELLLELPHAATVAANARMTRLSIFRKCSALSIGDL